MSLHDQEVSILGRTYTIKVEKVPEFAEAEAYIDHKTKRIVISPEYEDAEHLWHEILHEISWALALDLNEKMVVDITRAQWAVIRDNPWLLDEYFGADIPEEESTNSPEASPTPLPA